MSRIAYVNGRYCRHGEATVHIEDRGFQFADGVYEVIAVHGGRLVDEQPHLDRLTRSLAELRIAAPMAERALGHIMREVIRRNGVRDGIVYLQITRGAARRDHPFPQGVPSSLVVTARRSKPAPANLLDKGVAVITIPDIRWKRCDIKSVSLLPNVLGKQQAKEAGAYEAWMVDERGFVTEGTSTNAWIVTPGGVLVTRPTDHAILGGVTRRAVLALAAREGLTLDERPFSVDEARAAREAFITSTTSYVLPVTSLDGQPIGDGRAGQLSRKLRSLYETFLKAP